MIPVNDLRIGNWVIFNDDTDRNGQVLELSEYSAKLKCNYIPDHQENEVVSTTIDYEFILPIELTPELLEKCGFEHREPSVYYSVGRFDIYSGKGAFFYDTFRMKEVEIRYLHHLQNLFYSLTGKELEISL